MKGLEEAFCPWIGYSDVIMPRDQGLERLIETRWVPPVTDAADCHAPWERSGKLMIPDFEMKS